MDNDESGERKVSVEEIRDLIDRVLLPIPRPWLIALSLATFLSLFKISQTTEGGVLVGFEFTAISVTLLALFWLPFLLKVIALRGGSLKALGTEATFGGLMDIVSRLDPSDRREALPTLIATVETAESKSPVAERSRLRHVRSELESQLTTLAPEAQQARLQLQALARDYDNARETMKPSTERTLKLSSIVAQARALAKRAGYGSMEVSDLFAGESQGDRVVSLAIVQALRDTNFFDLVLQSIKESKSAFEQYEALNAAERMLSLLDNQQKKKLAALLEDQRSGKPGKHITRDSDRWFLSDRILKAIG